MRIEQSKISEKGRRKERKKTEREKQEEDIRNKTKIEGRNE